MRARSAAILGQLGDLVTIVVPTRDEERNVPGFLDSIPAGIPLIAVDASVDDTPRLIRTLRPRGTRIVRHPGGIALARDIGARSVRTPWILFTDVDIAFAPEYFDRLAEHIRRSDGGCGADCWYGPKLSADLFRGYYARFSRGQALLDRLGVPAASGSNMLVRRAAYRAVGGFDTELPCNEDSELGWRLARAGRRVRFARDLVVFARDHRRISDGRWRKSVHTALRCSLLYSRILPRSLRTHDWGYWSRTRT